MPKRILYLLTLFFSAQALGQTVTLTYWQYEFKTKVEAVNELIRTL